MLTASATRRVPGNVPQRLRWAARPLALWAVWRLLHLATVAAVGGRPDRWWDDGYYRTILRQGYRPFADYGVHQQTNFFPFLPWVTRVVQVVVRSETVAMNLVVTVAQVAAVLLLYAAAKRWRDERVALGAVALFLAVPASVFLWMFFTEGIFIALVIGAILAAEDDRPALAGMLGIGVAATRSMGVVIALPLALAALQHRRALDRRLLWCGLPALGLAAVMAAQWIQAGDPLAFVTVSGYRNTHAQFPLVTFFERIQFASEIGVTVGALVDIAAVVVTIGLGVYVARAGTLPWSVQAWLWLAAMTPLASGLPFSWSRYMLAAWPAAIVAAELLLRRPVLTRAVVILTLAAVTVNRLSVWHDGLFIG